MVVSLLFGLIIGFFGGFVSLKFSRFNFASSHISHAIIGSILSWGSVGIYTLLSGELYGMLGIAMGALVSGIFFLDTAVEFYKKYVIALSSTTLVAFFLYNGSERAIHFPILLTGSSFIALALATYIMKRKEITTNIATIIGAVCIGVGYLMSLLVGGDFFPHIQAIGIVLGIATSLVLIRARVLWKHIVSVTALTLIGYSLGDFYHVAIIVATMIGFMGVTRSEQKSDRTIMGITYVLLLYVFLRSVSFAGRSLLYDLSDPFVIAGLLIGVTIPYILPLITRRWIMYALTICIPIILVLLLGPIFGTIVLAGCMTGLILITITQGGIIQTAHKENELENYLLVFLLASIALTPLVH